MTPFRIAGVLLFLPLIARAAFVAGPETAVSPVTYASAQVTPLATASDGSDTLVLWGPRGLFASRVPPSGEVSLASQVKISDGYAERVSIVWTGVAYLVTWQVSGNVMVAALDRDGALSVPPRQILSSVLLQPPSLASDGRSALLIYITGPDYTAHGMLLDVTGNVLNRDIALPLRTTDPFGGDLRPPVLVGSDDQGYVVFWSRMINTLAAATGPSSPLPGPTNFVTTYYAVRIGSDGALSESAPRVLGTAGNTDPFAVAYAHGRYALVAAQVGGTLKRFIVDAATLATSTLPEMGSQYSLGLTTNSADFVLYGFNGTQPGLHVARFSGDPEVVPPSFSTVAPFAMPLGYGPFLQWNGTGYVAVWQAPGANVAMVDSAFSTAVPLTIGFAPQRQYSPAVAAGGDQSLVVWYESDGSGAGMRAVRIQNGVVLDAEPLTIANDVRVAYYGGKPAVAFTGTAYLAAWITPGGMAEVRRIGLDGSMADAVEVASVPFNSAIAAAANGKVTALVFAASNGIGAIRFSPSGERIDATPIVVSTKYAATLRVATNGTDFLVAWSAAPSLLDFWMDLNRRDVNAVRLFAGGSVDAAPIGVATGAGDQVVDDVASNGIDDLVAYQTPEPRILVKRVSQQGVVMDSTANSPGIVIGTGSDASLAGVGTGYAVAWTRSQSEIDLASTDTAGNPLAGKIALTSLAPELWSYGDTSVSIALAANRIIAAYARPFTDPRSPISTRVFVRIVDRDAPRARAIRHR